MTPTILQIHWGSRYTDSMEQLRRIGFSGYGQSVTSRDKFDDYSQFATAVVDNKAVGTIRATMPPPSVIQAWACEPLPLPCDQGTVELTRGVVAPEWQGLGVYKLLMAYTVLVVGRDIQPKCVTAAVELSFPGWSYLQQLGFHQIGNHYRQMYPPLTRPHHIRCIICDSIAEMMPKASGIFADLREMFAGRGVEVHADL